MTIGPNVASAHLRTDAEVAGANGDVPSSLMALASCSLVLGHGPPAAQVAESLGRSEGELDAEEELSLGVLNMLLDVDVDDDDDATALEVTDGDRVLWCDIGLIAAGEFAIKIPKSIDAEELWTYPPPNRSSKDPSPDSWADDDEGGDHCDNDDMSKPKVLLSCGVEAEGDTESNAEA